MSNEISFNANELLLMYFVMKGHVSETNDMLDSGEYDGFTRDELIDNNKLSNSVIRKLRNMMVANGINPDDFLHSN